MPDRVKEKLVEWLCEAMILFDKRKDEKGINPFEVFADHLITHGVTVQEWISVADHLPASGECVIVCRKGGKVEQGVFLGVNGWWKVYGTNTKSVTHWMPLPQPPKGE